MRRPIALATLFITLAAAPLAAQTQFETAARSAYVVDVTTDTVLLEKNADTPLPPASMSKLMTLFMLFEAVRDNPNVTMDTRFGVSTKARQMGGSTMFLNERDRPTVEELIKGIIVQSGNDASVVVAEGLAGSEAAFAQMMNERAATLGMQNSHFENASGWPDPGHRMSTHDLAILAEHMIEDFPQIYEWFSMTEWGYDGRAPDNRFNRNPLLDLGIGVDGLKTGHTQEAGYGLAGSAQQGNRRIVFVYSGLPSAAARREEGERIVSWAFRQFVSTTLASEGDRIAEAPVWMGDAREVGLIAPRDLTVLAQAMSQDAVTAEVVFDGPIAAPISAGDQIGQLVVAREGLPQASLPLVADRDIAYGGFVPRVRSAGEILLGKLMVQVGSVF